MGVTDAIGFSTASVGPLPMRTCNRGNAAQRFPPKRNLAVSNDEGGSRGSSYVEWKGWVDQTPFVNCLPGSRPTSTANSRDLRVAPGDIEDVLGIGYRNGAFLSYCSERGWKVTDTELEPAVVQAGANARFAVFVSDRMTEITDRSFDLIAVFDVLEHLPEDAVPEFLAELSRKLREGGEILFRFPSADSWLGNAFQNGDSTEVNAI